MHILWLCSYIVLCLVLTGVGGAAQAATPEQIFARAAPSMVVVEVVDEKGTPAAQGSGAVTVPGSSLLPVMWPRLAYTCESGMRRHRLPLLWATPTPNTTCARCTRQSLQAPACGTRFREKPRCRAAGLYHQYPSGTESDVYSGDYFGPTSRPWVVFDPDGRSCLARLKRGGLFDRAGRLIGMPCFQMQRGPTPQLCLARGLDRESCPAARPAYGDCALAWAAPPDWVQRSTALRTPKRLLGTVKPGSND